MEQIIQTSKSYSKWITVVSVAIPVVVAVLLFAPVKLSFENGGWIQLLPTLNAVINSATAILLLAALAAIKTRRTTLHRNLMMTALGLGTLFLLSYVLYHASTVSTVYGDINHDGVLSEAERAEIGVIERSICLPCFHTSLCQSWWFHLSFSLSIMRSQVSL